MKIRQVCRRYNSTKKIQRRIQGGTVVLIRSYEIFRFFEPRNFRNCSTPHRRMSTEILHSDGVRRGPWSAEPAKVWNFFHWVLCRYPIKPRKICVRCGMVNGISLNSMLVKGIVSCRSVINCIVRISWTTGFIRNVSLNGDTFWGSVSKTLSILK